MQCYLTKGWLFSGHIPISKYMVRWLICIRIMKNVISRTISTLLQMSIYPLLQLLLKVLFLWYSSLLFSIKPLTFQISAFLTNCMFFLENENLVKLWSRMSCNTCNVNKIVIAVGNKSVSTKGHFFLSSEEATVSEQSRETCTYFRN